MIALCRTLYTALENPRSRWFSATNDTLALVTILSVLIIALESVTSLKHLSSLFTTIEYIAVAFFSIEYIVRFSQRKTQYAFSFFGAVDLLAIIPSLLGLGNLTFLKSARVLRILRFLRVLRLAKLARTATLHPTTQAEDRLRLERLNLAIYFISLASAVIIFGALIYTAEGYRVEFANMFLGMLWAAKVILGGIYQTVPETLSGEIIIISARFVGLVLFGLLITVIGGFVQKLLFGNVTKTQKM